MKDKLTKWDNYFLNLLEHVSDKSKDNSTKVAAIIVGKDNNIISTGFNGFPMNVVDDITLVPERYNRPEKYDFTIHAEMNALFMILRSGMVLPEDTKMYVSLFPCITCACAIIQCGIKKVYAPNIMDDYERLKDTFKFDKTIQVFKEANIELQLY